MDFVTLIGFVAAGLVIATLSMRTMVPLRMIGIASNVAFITYGYYIGSLPTVVLHSVLFPLNVYRLQEMLKLVREVKAASRGDHSMDWLKPFMTKRAMQSGEYLFRKGDGADEMYFLLNGKLHLEELDIELQPGAVVGELGFLTPDGTRTQSLRCSETGSILTISYERIEELYYQNPTFGFYFLRLASSRLFENIGRLEQTISERNAELDRLRSHSA